MQDLNMNSITAFFFIGFIILVVVAMLMITIGPQIQRVRKANRIRNKRANIFRYGVPAQPDEILLQDEIQMEPFQV